MEHRSGTLFHMRHLGHATKLITNAQRERFREASKYRGLFARIARELKLERSHVRRVAIGERSSRRVEKALRAAMDEIDQSRRAA